VTLRAPFPWFGGKSRAASVIWSRFGDVTNYVEPFAGSLAVLLARPHEPRAETVNDYDAFLANFWRATAADPEAVARYADWPVNEADLHARHSWLVNTGSPIVERLREDPEYFDAKVAGWWVWGQCLWIGSGWCKPIGAKHANGTRKAIEWLQRPDLSSANGRGGAMLHTSQKRPNFKRGNAPGVHRLSQQIPDLAGDYGAVGRGVHSKRVRRAGLIEYFDALRERLRRVRVTCGDWSRVTGPAVTTCIGLTGILLDPPYGDAERCPGLYSRDNEGRDLAGEARRWALENGDNRQLRIALCGYEGEHGMPESWQCVAWRAGGGYGARTTRGKENAGRERIWFSPHCLDPEMTPGLFDAAEGA
jgi:DNA adenine methylase